MGGVPIIYLLEVEKNGGKKKSLVHNGCFFLVGAESPLAVWKGDVMFPRRRDRKTDETNQTRVTLAERQDAEETGSNRIGRPRTTLVALPWFLHGSAHNSSLGEKDSWVPTLSPTPTSLCLLQI